MISKTRTITSIKAITILSIAFSFPCEIYSIFLIEQHTGFAGVFKSLLYI